MPVSSVSTCEHGGIWIQGDKNGFLGRKEPEHLLKRLTHQVRGILWQE